LTLDPKDGRKHPAIVWAHGGFGGIGSYYWSPQPADNDQTPKAFVDAGLVVMLPSWRGENDNPGKFELFYGEIDDAVAAIDYVAALPFVDPTRIYLAGHSTGGTVVLLTALSTDKLRAAFSFGGAPDLGHVVGNGKGYGNTPFDARDAKESQLRSANRFVATLKTPTWYFEGSDSFYVGDAREMERRAARVAAPFHAFIVDGGNHFSILRPLTRMLARKLVLDDGPRCNITISSDDIAAAFRAGRTSGRD
jgi:dipeptidyl aminopeptidase/acylaminoacyl peptidase